MRLSKKLLRLTNGGTLAIAEMKRQMIPYRNDDMSIDRKKHRDSLQEQPSHLLPEESGQTNHATTIIAQAKQTNKHDEK